MATGAKILRLFIKPKAKPVRIRIRCLASNGKHSVKIRINEARK